MVNEDDWGFVIAMVLLIMTSIWTCPPFLLLLHQDGKLRVSDQTPTFALGIPWDARVPAKKLTEILELCSETNTWQLLPGLARTSALQRSFPGGIPHPRSCSVLRWGGSSCPRDTQGRPELPTPYPYT